METEEEIAETAEESQVNPSTAPFFDLFHIPSMLRSLFRLAIPPGFPINVKFYWYLAIDRRINPKFFFLFLFGETELIDNKFFLVWFSICFTSFFNWDPLLPSTKQPSCSLVKEDSANLSERRNHFIFHHGVSNNILSIQLIASYVSIKFHD